MTNRLQNGFTLIELTVVLMVSGLLFAISLPSFSKLSEMRDYRDAVRQVVSAANGARAMAHRTQVPVDLIFHVDDKRLAVVGVGGVPDEWALFQLPDSLELTVTSAAALSESADTSVIRFYPAGGASGGDIALIRDSGGGTLIQIGWLLADVRQTKI